MPDLVHRLAQQIVQDNAILFVGAGLRQGEGGWPAIHQIAESLAQRIGYEEPDRSLPAVAQSFELLEGRNELIVAIGEELERLGSRPSPQHQLIADAVLPHTKVITTGFDQVLEQALRQFNKRYVLIVRDTDVPAFDETRVTLIKVHGDIAQSDSLVITEDDIDDFIDRLPTVSDVIRAFFATKTLVFMGYDLNNDLFKRFFRQVGRKVSAFRRPSYAIVPEPLTGTKSQYWQRQNVQVVVQDPLVFLEGLAQAIKESVQRAEAQPPNPLADLASPPLPPRPYKSLDSFTGADVAIFSGREEESQRLTNRILAHRLTILYGESGSGKTSLLQAGAGPRLADRRALLAVCAPAPGQDLELLLYDSLIQAGGQARLEPQAGGPLAETLRSWQRTLDGPVVLAIDQFEQFFLAYDPEECQAAVVLLDELLVDRSLDVRLVLIVREDFLGRLQALEAQVAGLLDVRFRLERLGQEAARAAIEEPARHFDVRWEPDLVQVLLDDLYEGAGVGVAPPQLQIVCDRLYQEAIGAEPAGGIEISRTLFRELGGTQAILGDYVDRAVQEFPSEQQSTVRTLLGALVSSSGAKQRLALDALARAAEVEPQTTEAILDALTRQRIVQRYEVAVEGAPVARLEYELAHDYLAARIGRWLGGEFWEAQQAREIVRQALPDWQSRGGLLAPDDLELIAAQQDRVRSSPEEQELIYASTVGYADCASEVQSALDDAVCRRVLLRLVHYPDESVRENIVCALVAFPAEATAQALVEAAARDPDLAVREAAARTIARCLDTWDTGLGQAMITSLATDADVPDRSEQALHALTIVRDLWPACQDMLPVSLRPIVRRRLWAVRWRRHQRLILSRTVRGAQGGFLGLGLGLGAFLGLNGVYAAGQDRLIWQAVVAAMSVGVPLAGVLGMLAAGLGALARVALRSLQDVECPWRSWAVVTVTGMAVMGLGFVLMAQIFSGSVQPARTVGAGLLIGLGVAGGAALPLRLPRVLRLALAVVIGMASFVLVWRLGLIYNRHSWSLLWMGAVGGAGFFWGLEPSQKSEPGSDQV